MIDLRPYVYHLPSQDGIGCCTASASLLAAEMLCKMNSKPQIFSRLFLYYFTRKLQDRLPMKGAELSATLETLSTRGVCIDALWPFMKHKENREPTPQCIEEARTHKVESYSSINRSEINYCLDNRIPVIAGMWTGRKFWKLSGKLETQEYSPINGIDNRLSHGHAVTIIGYNNDLRGGSWIIANSVGHRWGHNGYGAIPYSCETDIGEAYIIKAFAGMAF